MVFFGLNHLAGFLKGGFILTAVAGTIALAAISPPSLSAAQARQAVIAVKGMSCLVCAHRLEKVLAKLQGAEKAQVDLQKSQATVDFAPNAKVSDKDISQRVRDAGFVPGKVEWRAADRER